VKFLCRCFLRHEENRDLIFQKARCNGRQIFFQHLRIRKDGGLNMVNGHQLFSMHRVMAVFTMLFFVCFNFYTVVFNLLSLIKLKNPNAVFPVVVEPNLERTKMLFVTWQLLFAAYETGVMLLMVTVSMFIVIKFNTCTSVDGMKHYRVWHLLRLVCQSIIPTMTNFSAMRAVQFLNPQVLSASFKIALTEVENGHSLACVLGTFALQHVAFGVSGFCAFVLKFSTLVASLATINNSPEGWNNYAMATELLLLIGFLNQTCGITQISRVETKRLFLFVFGGENSEMEAGELDRQEVYLACVAQHICRDLYKEDPPLVRKFKRAVALQSFDHFDIQSMILHENEMLEVDAKTIRQSNHT